MTQYNINFNVKYYEIEKELLKNVSDKEIEDFLNDTKAMESDDLLTDNEIFN